MRALVIDDSRAMRSILTNILIECGFEVVSAGNGKEGLEKLAQAGAVELALVDWNMPVMNGLEFVQAVRGDSTHADMRIVMVTSETELTQINRALEAGANEYIMKPFTKDVILGKLEMLGVSPV